MVRSIRAVVGIGVDFTGGCRIGVRLLYTTLHYTVRCVASIFESSQSHPLLCCFVSGTMM